MYLRSLVYINISAFTKFLKILDSYRIQHKIKFCQPLLHS